MTAANNKTHTVKGNEKRKKEKNTQHIIVNIKKKSIKALFAGKYFMAHET